jgi:hypothetical protein
MKTQQAPPLVSHLLILMVNMRNLCEHIWNYILCGAQAQRYGIQLAD